jgi:hypothetical protein
LTVGAPPPSVPTVPSPIPTPSKLSGFDNSGVTKIYGGCGCGVLMRLPQFVWAD